MASPMREMMDTYLKKELSRLHMPGHKGTLAAPLAEAARYDLTEAGGLDSLYECSAGIRETEVAFAALYGAHRTLLSAGGSTLCIQTMLALAAGRGSKVLAVRGLHTAAVNAMALLRLEPVWLLPEDPAGYGIGGRTSPNTVEAALRRHPDAAAVYITSPDYYGVLSDVRGIAAVCARFGVPLLVDNAHGAHLKFMRPDLHPMTQGAAMCCDSLHKTLPVLTGGALLHLADGRFADEAKAKMALFGSTSPSYLIMLSCSECLDFLQTSAPVALERTAVLGAELEQLAAARGFVPLTGVRDRTKVVLSVYNWGCGGTAFAELLRSFGIEPEYVDDCFAVLMLSPATTAHDVERIRHFIQQAPLPLGGMRPPESGYVLPRAKLELWRAVLSPAEILPTDSACGRVAAGSVTACPPGVPLVMPGEELDKETVNLLKTYGVQAIKVVK